MPDSLRRCSLPGCDNPIPASPSEHSTRKYCCPEHRIAARWQRHKTLAEQARSAITDADALSRTDQTIDPEADLEPPPTEPDPQPSPTSHHRPGHRESLAAMATTARDRVRKTTQRALKGLEAATERPLRWNVVRTTAGGGMVIAGVVWAIVAFTSSNGMPGQPVAEPKQPALPNGLTAWTAGASAELTSIANQLGEVARGEAAWPSVPPQDRNQILSSDYARLEADKVMLRAQQSTLQNDLLAADRERHAYAALLANRNAAAGNGRHASAASDQLRQDFDRWDADVRSFLATPLPDLSESTIVVLVQAIVEASNQGVSPQVVIAVAPAHGAPAHSSTKSSHGHGGSATSTQSPYQSDVNGAVGLFNTFLPPGKGISVPGLGR